MNHFWFFLFNLTNQTSELSCTQDIRVILDWVGKREINILPFVSPSNKQIPLFQKAY
jgi:hypothetical protein